MPRSRVRKTQVNKINNGGRASRVAIIGMVIRCPGAKNVDEFWSNLKNGVESISFFTEGELRKAGISEAVLRLPTFIRAGAPLEGLDLFDAGFFNYSAREAEFIDPQQRIFLECAVEALETAGVDPAGTPAKSVYLPAKARPCTATKFWPTGRDRCRKTDGGHRQ